MGPVILMLGIVLVLLGGAGLLASTSASHSRMRTTKPVVHLAQFAVGVLLAGVGAALVFA